MLKLGTLVFDRATGLRGTLMSACISGDGKCYYTFQPQGLSAEGDTAPRAGLDESRIMDGKQADTDPPLDLIGTEAQDTVTGYKGVITHLVYHVNGCVHAVVVAKGKNKKTGGMNEDKEFDLRMLKGKSIEKLNAAELAASRKKNPSPSGSVARQRTR